MQMIDQAGWGSTLEYDDGDLNGEWDPQYVVIHWGGLTSEIDTLEREEATLQGWQRYHLGKGWQDIAYNYAVGESGNLYRLRGENHGGHTSGTDPVTGKSWSTVGIGVVWIGGQRDGNGPSSEALNTMIEFCQARGLPLLGHQDTGKATACPGPDWLGFVEDYNDGEYDMSVAPNIDECKPHQVGAWQEAFEDGKINEHTHPQDVLTKGDYFTLEYR